MLEILGWLVLVVSAALLTVALVNMMWQSARRRERRNMRRLMAYMDQVPPWQAR